MNMNFSAWSIRNPVIPVLLFVVLMALGIYGFRALPITRFPNIDIPVVTVTIKDTGSAPAELETQITKKVEDTVAGITGVKHLGSTITDSQSVTSVEFNVGIATDRALNDVKDAIAKIRSDLPSSINEPIIQRVDVEGAAILTFSISSPGRTLEQLSWFVDDVMIRQIQGLKGVGRVERLGGVTREIQVQLDPDRLASLGITAADVSNQLKAMNGDMAGGRGTVDGQEQTIRALAASKTVTGLADTMIVLPRSRNVLLSDLGKVVDSYKEPASFATNNGTPAVVLSVYRAKGESDWSVSQVSQAKVAQIVEANQDISVRLVDESVTYTYGNYSSAMETLFEGALLAVIVVLIFLRDLRATLIACVALPLAAIPTFWAMQMMGFSLNLVSLLAVTLVTGILVDDAIVEIENISRHIHMGKSPYRASIEAADEIGMAVIAITFTIIAIFSPVSFMSGIAGQYFKQFGLVVAFAVFFSLLVARLITPMMTAYLMRPPYLGDGSDGRPVYKGFVASLRGYLIPLLGLSAVIAIATILLGSMEAPASGLIASLHAEALSLIALPLVWQIGVGLGGPLAAALVLTWLNAPHNESDEIGLLGKIYTGVLRASLYRVNIALGMRKDGTRRDFALPVGPFATVALAFAFFQGSMAMVPLLPTGFIPPVDASRIVISLELPPGSRLEDTRRVTDQLTTQIKAIPVVKDVLVLGGTSPNGTLEYRRATVITNLVRKDKRTITQPQVEAQIEKMLQTIPDVRNYYVNDRNDRPYQVGVQSADADQLNETVARIESEMRRNPVFNNPSADASYQRPEIQIHPKKEEASSLGITTDAVAQTVRVATIGNTDSLLPKFTTDGRQIPIRVMLDTKFRQDPAVIAALQVNTGSGASVPLSAIADVQYGQGPSTITRYDRFRQVKIGSSLAPGKEVSDAEAALRKLPSVVNMPKAVHLAATGDTEAQSEIFTGFALAMGSGIMMVFVLLILLLGNVFQPVTILASLPLSVGGVVGALYLTHNSISMPVVIGILMLMGIVTKNAIMLVDFAVERVRHGMDRSAAVIEAGRMRARPIIMTTIAMAAGMAPAAMAAGEGGEFRAPMAIAVMGGLLVSTGLSLLFIPAVYTLMDDLSHVTSWVFRAILQPNAKDEAPEGQADSFSEASAAHGHSHEPAVRLTAANDHRGVTLQDAAE